MSIIKLNQSQKLIRTRNGRDTAKHFVVEAPNGQLRVESVDSKDLEHLTGRKIMPKTRGWNNVPRDADATLRPALHPTPSFSSPARCLGHNMLLLTVTEGIIKDGKHRTGYIAGNHQFQFDDPPQSGALLTAGFSLCDDGLLALGRSATWYSCSSGNFSNIYDEMWASHCQAVHLQAIQIFDCSLPGLSSSVHGPSTTVPSSTSAKTTQKASSNTLTGVAHAVKTSTTTIPSKTTTSAVLEKLFTTTMKTTTTITSKTTTTIISKTTTTITSQATTTITPRTTTTITETTTASTPKTTPTSTPNTSTATMFKAITTITTKSTTTTTFKTTTTVTPSTTTRIAVSASIQASAVGNARPA